MSDMIENFRKTLAPQGESSIADIEAMSPEQRELLYQGMPVPSYRKAHGLGEWLNEAGGKALYMLLAKVPYMNPALLKLLTGVGE